MGKPSDVLNRYQKLIMARESAYEENQSTPETEETAQVEVETLPKLSFTYRHGDGSAEITAVELLNTVNQRVEFVETGEEVVVRVRVHFREPLEAPVCGFLIRNRHGIHLYGTNTDLQQVDLGPVQRGEVIEVSFAFNCWLAPDNYSLTVGVHSLDGISFDWVDGVLFFHVLGTVAMEGVTNLNASARFRRLGHRSHEAAVTAEAVNT
jgi:lipopolysaccharide transport system ATP-binding protein